LLGSEHMNRVTANIAGGHEHVAAKLPLNRQVPVLDLCRIDVIHRSVISVYDERCRWTVLRRKWVNSVESCSRCIPWIAENGILNRRGRGGGRYDRGPQMVLRVGIVISDSGRRAHRGLAVAIHIPGESQAWRKFPPVQIAAAFSRESRIAGEIEAQR